MKLTTTVLSSGWQKWRHTNTLKANSHIPCRAPAALHVDLEESLIERHGRGTSEARHGHGIASVNQTWSNCVNQMGKTQSKPLATRHGRGKVWWSIVVRYKKVWWAIREGVRNIYIYIYIYSHIEYRIIIYCILNARRNITLVCLFVLTLFPGQSSNPETVM